MDLTRFYFYGIKGLALLKLEERRKMFLQAKRGLGLRCSQQNKLDKITLLLKG